MESKTYEVSTIFYSIQGEGLHAGMPAVFIRFCGCNLTCDFCDEPTHTLPGIRYTVIQILETLKTYPSKTLILTGGEPTLQLDSTLIHALKQNGYRLHLETNGTQSIPKGLDWVTVSPKTPLYEIGDELKVIYQGQDMEAYCTKGFQYQFIQPLSHQNVEACIAFVKAHPSWRLSIQFHRLLAIP
jgi:7-carboxy-7-deazaguanine synthase